VRSQTLVEPSDLWATLLDWWGFAPQRHGESLLPMVRQDAAVRRDRLCVVGTAPSGPFAPGLVSARRRPAAALRQADDRWKSTTSFLAVRTWSSACKPS